MEQLQAPFAESDYEWRLQSVISNESKARVLCYVTNRAIQNRLDDVFGPFGWQVAYKPGPDGGVVCRMACKDPDSKEWITKEDGAENTQIESVKGGISSACKRAAVAWGIGRLLYNLEAAVVPLEANGQHYYKCKDGKYKYWDAPVLPDWAVSGRTPKVEQPPATKPAPKQKKHADRNSLKVHWAKVLGTKGVKLKTADEYAAVAMSLQNHPAIENVCKEIGSDLFIIQSAKPDACPDNDELWNVLGNLVVMMDDDELQENVKLALATYKAKGK